MLFCGVRRRAGRDGQHNRSENRGQFELWNWSCARNGIADAGLIPGREQRIWRDNPGHGHRNRNWNWSTPGHRNGCRDGRSRNGRDLGLWR